jgi:hypothetical protein
MSPGAVAHFSSTSVATAAAAAAADAYKTSASANQHNVEYANVLPVQQLSSSLVDAPVLAGAVIQYIVYRKITRSAAK